MRRTHAAAIVAVFVAAAIGVSAGQQEGRIRSTMRSKSGLTDVPGIKVGQVTRSERPTGCTVILAEAGAVAGVDVRGSAPGTIETDLLNPVNLVQQVHGVFLSGGSAFGLDVATGVRKYLYERKIGFETRVAKVPIVPGAIIFDLGVGNRPDIWPTADCGYRAAADATDGDVAEGNVGAGAGATVGKMGGGAMKGGIGTASISVPASPNVALVVAAIVAVNAVGDVIDPAHRGGSRGSSRARWEDLCGCAQAFARRRAAGKQGWPEHDHRRDCHERPVDESAGDQGRADGAGRTGPGNLSRAHHGRRRCRVRAGDRRNRKRRRVAHRRAGRRRDGRGDSACRSRCERHSRVSGSRGDGALVTKNEKRRTKKRIKRSADLAGRPEEPR